MMEENPNTSKDRIAATNIPSYSLSYFISNAMRCQSRFPRLMVKTKHSRSRRTKRGNQFPKEVGSVFSAVFGNNRSLGKKYEAHSDSESLLGKSGSQDGKEWHFTAEGNNLVYGNQPIVGPLSQLLKLEVEKTLDPHGAEEGKHNRKDKHPVLPLTSFVNQKKSWNFFKTSYSGKAAKDSTDVVSGWRLLRIKVRSCRLVRVVSRILTITSSLKKRVRKQFEDDRNREEDDEGHLCLCKKRILMGGRCKPLYSSGALQYDTDGLLIPDIVP